MVKKHCIYVHIQQEHFKIMTTGLIIFQRLTFGPKTQGFHSKFLKTTNFDCEDLFEEQIFLVLYFVHFKTRLQLCLLILSLTPNKPQIKHMYNSSFQGG